MRKTLVALALGAALLGARTSLATPAMPRPLERIVEDAELVVVAKLRTKPAHPGDEFSFDVEQTLKGRPAETTLSAKAASFFTGCLVSDDPPPPPPSIEGRATRAILFLDAERQSSDPILLDPDDGASAWFGESRPAAAAVGAIKALAELDLEPDVARAAALWDKGLGGDDPLVASCLLLRIGFASRIKPGQDACELGPRLGPLANAQLHAARALLLPHLTRFVADEKSPLRVSALWQSYTCLYDGLFDEGPDRDALLAAVRAASRASDQKVRHTAVSCLAAARDPEVPERWLAALRKRPLDRAALGDFSDFGRVMVQRSFPERERELIAAAAALLDEPGAEDLGVGTLARLTGNHLGTIETWRGWWKTEKTK